MPLECERPPFVGTADVKRIHRLIPPRASVELDNTNITVSMHSQKRSVAQDLPGWGWLGGGGRTRIHTLSRAHRHLNWTLKALKLKYGREDEQLPLKSFRPELSFPQSSLELLLEGRGARQQRLYNHKDKPSQALCVAQ